VTSGSWDLPVAEALRKLQAEYGPAWMIWYVPTWDGRKAGIIWCAKRLRDGRLLHACQPRHLAAYIADASIPTDR
jgi:hypothetical protein